MLTRAGNRDTGHRTRPGRDRRPDQGPPQAGPRSRADEPPRTGGLARGFATGSPASGTVLLVRQWYPWFGADLFWPLIVVAVGLLVVFSGRRGR
jgi:hypothetical protein